MKTCCNPKGSPDSGSIGPNLRASSYSARVIRRLSLATKPRLGDSARFVKVWQAARLVRLTGATPPPTLGQAMKPRLERKGWSARNSVEKVWSLFDRRLK